MAFTAKLTMTRGKVRPGDIVISAGAAEAARDVISVNIDADKLTMGEAAIMLQNMSQALLAGKWPIN